MNNICQVFNECSYDIFNWLTKQPEVKEESMTDRFLFNISEKLPIVQYKQFSRIDEGKTTGADWEWWFLFPDDKAFCARVQAKKLKNDKDNYAGIAYTRNGTLQIERLIDDSKSEGFASLYAFYSSEVYPKTLCMGDESSQGVFLSEAEQLKSVVIDNPRTKYLAKDLLNYANPLSCLFCCPLSADLSYDGFKKHLRTYFPTLFKNSTPNDPIGFVKTPHRIIQLLEIDTASWWETEYRNYIENVDAIMIIDLRDMEKKADNG